MAKKGNSSFNCSECGFESAKWQGKCPQCEAWNSFEEIAPSRVSLSGKKVAVTLNELSEVSGKATKRYKTGISEFDNVLGGGIVPGSLILLGGEPGIGKSTLLLQASSHLSQYGKVFYNNGEESAQQIKLRSDRLNIKEKNIYLMDETGLDAIEEGFRQSQPIGAVIDSIQTVYRPDIQGLPGSLSQIKEGANLFLNVAKRNGPFIFLVGHVTKEGNIAGPKTLEHIVDVVLYLEGEKHHSFRILRSYKNRFGSTDEMGVFQMTGRGIEEVKNPSEYFIQDYNPSHSGTMLSAIHEGSRPLLVEVQALVSSTHFNFPKRMVDGTDINKVHKLIAILEKVLGLVLVQNDVYVNITGGIRVKEPGVELAILMAIYSSFKKIPGNRSMVFIGEVGLGGEIRGVSGIHQRVNEAIKLGIETIVVPTKSFGELSPAMKKENVVPVSSVRDVVEYLNR
ncbi:MAG: DNA repair protein RadA [Spirochaetota bacterium]|nr:DNA repair protein RadA [Spirochaetota bacterium]